MGTKYVTRTVKHVARNPMKEELAKAKLRIATSTITSQMMAC